MLKFSAREIQRLKEIVNIITEDKLDFALTNDIGGSDLDWLTSDLILACIQHVIEEAADEQR